MFQLWDPSIVELLRQRDFPQGTELGGYLNSDAVNLSMLYATDLSKGELFIFFLPHEVYARDTAGQDVYHAHGYKSSIETIELMI